VEKLCKKFINSEDQSRKWIADQLWRAFPEATSEKQLSKLVAEVLTTKRRSVHWKTVNNWLQHDHAPHFRYVMPILFLVLGERLLDLIDSEAA